ncbi:hypothetical protein E3Q13_01544 [Wallemia mellicola]|nr:hypothetical protein E3Q13_01544 [Wallemia mellicola]
MIALKYQTKELMGLLAHVTLARSIVAQRTRTSRNPLEKNKAFISTGDIVSQLSLNCNNIALGGNILIEDQCKNTPACCEDVSGSTLSCSPLTLV